MLLLLGLYFLFVGHGGGSDTGTNYQVKIVLLVIVENIGDEDMVLKFFLSTSEGHESSCRTNHWVFKAAQIWKHWKFVNSFSGLNVTKKTFWKWIYDVYYTFPL